MAKAGETKKRILEIAEEAVLQKGFNATSIDEIIVEAEITKSGFFYHFKDKNELALGLIDRYIEQDDQIFDEIFERAGQLSKDPLQRLLIGLQLLAEMLDDLPTGHPGCLVATFCYQERLFRDDVIARNKAGLLSWRSRFRLMFEDILTQYVTKDSVEVDDLADMISSAIEGGIVLSKAVKEPMVLGKQIRLARSYFELLFEKIN